MPEQALRTSLAGRLALILSVSSAATILVALALTRTLDSWWLAAVLACLICLPIAAFVVHRTLSPVVSLLDAVADGISSLKDGDFSVSIANTRSDELRRLVGSYNELGDVLRSERQNLFQRELLLDTVIQTAPQATVLTNSNGTIVYSNTAARHLFLQGKPLNGHRLHAVLENGQRAFRDALTAERDGLFTVESDSEPQTYHLSVSGFSLNAQPHRLYVLRQLTHELSRQEVATWKKVIRVISHELNNSLAPISSMAHSGQIVSKRLEDQRLTTIFTTIEERATHLRQFIDGYGRFARLPAPRIGSVQWPSFVGSLGRTLPMRLVGSLPAQPASFDATQIEQVLINLLKNARESGSAEEAIELEIRELGSEIQINVRDRGTGMSDSVLDSALLPFYSTKKTGTGIGLPLCREIVEAHGGRLSFSNRQDGGLDVQINLPQHRTAA